MLSSLARGIWPFLYVCMIFALSSIPESREAANVGSALLRALPGDVQNIFHIPLYALLAWLCYRALTPLPFMRAAAWTLVIVMAYATFDELHQSTVSGRVASLEDWLLDLAGALLTLCLLQLREARSPAA